MGDLVNAETGELVEAMSEAEAVDITAQISAGLGEIADQYELIMPLIREAMTRRAYAALGYRSAGEYISEEFGGALHRLGVEARRGVVRELADAGLSTRAIAPVVGVGDSTVQRDLASTAPSGAVEAEAEPTAPITGLNGKSYKRPTAKPKPQREREIDREESEAKRRADEEREANTHTYSRLAEGLEIVGSYGQYEDPLLIMNGFDWEFLHPPQLDRFFEIENLESAARFIDALIEWRKS